MIPDFKIYVPVLNEEVLIGHVVDSLISVFRDNVEVMDLGCTDSSIEQIKNKVNVISEPLPTESPGQFYTDLKNRYSKNQSRVLWVDGDEIYPQSTLLKIKEILESGNLVTSEMIYCRILKEIKGQTLFSEEFLPAGTKLFNSNWIEFRRSWPKEVYARVDNGGEPRKGQKDFKFNGLWFWHGVLLRRTNSNEGSVRLKKQLTKEQSYDKALSWQSFDILPWKNDFKSQPINEWKICHIRNTPHMVRYWTGVLDA